MSGSGKEGPFKLTFSGLKVITSPADHYLDADWRTILMTPIWVFEAVASADKTTDEKERAALIATLEAPPTGTFSAFVFSAVRKRLDELLAALTIETRTPLAGIADAELLLAGYPKAEEADEFRRALLVLANNVGNASGGGLFGIGSKLTEVEAAVIAKIAALFHIAR